MRSAESYPSPHCAGFQLRFESSSHDVRQRYNSGIDLAWRFQAIEKARDTGKCDSSESSSYICGFEWQTASAWM